ncbi:unnamed protein product [Microthlaspi erraticum]|uniref:Secreted protein n=1 Tax=Microthlaspi erraticum TaxID=1685480 RepID=A0A6D2L9N0_9BRAS|nr:unnamed protein product [Microthlaspi erraticum]
MPTIPWSVMCNVVAILSLVHRGWCRARCVLSSFVGDQSTGAAFKCIRALGQNVGDVALFRNYALRAVLALLMSSVGTQLPVEGRSRYFWVLAETGTLPKSCAFIEKDCLRTHAGIKPT